MLLNEVQAHFKDLMLDTPDALTRIDPTFAAQFEAGRIPLARRFEVYKNNIVTTLSSVIVTNFPILTALVGDDFLRGAARIFILQNPPQQGCLNHYGIGFDLFLFTFEPAAALPYLPDVARMELAIHAAYHAPDEPALTPDALASVAPDALGDLVLEPQEKVSLIQSDYPLLAIKTFCEGGSEGTLDINQGDAHLMVTRIGIEPQLVTVERDEFMALSLLGGGKALGESVESVLADFPAFDFQAFLQKHLALETFRGLVTNKG